MGEEWRDVVGYEGYYQVSDYGRLKSTPRPNTSGGILKQETLKKLPYQRVSLVKNGETKRFLTHRLVLIAFVGQPTENEEARHLDGVPTNNRLNNLAWSTATENNRDRIIHGTMPDLKGSKHPAAKLSEQDVFDIRDMLANKTKPKIIAKKFDITNGTVSAIKTKRIWSHI